MTTKINYSITTAHLPSPQYWYHFITRERQMDNTEECGELWGCWRMCVHGHVMSCQLRTCTKAIKKMIREKITHVQLHKHFWNTALRRISCGLASSMDWAYYNTPANLGLQASLPPSASERGENLVWKPNHTQRSEFSRWGSSSSRLHQAIIQS